MSVHCTALGSEAKSLVDYQEQCSSFDGIRGNVVAIANRYNTSMDYPFDVVTYFDASKNEFSSREIYGFPRYKQLYFQSFTIDADGEVQKRYHDEIAARAEARRQEREAELAKLPQKGRRIRVLAGTRRAIHDGKTGTVFWFGENHHRGGMRYAKGYVSQASANMTSLFNKRVGFIDDKTGEKVFINAERVEVVQEGA